jgi:hypothetical protein
VGTQRQAADHGLAGTAAGAALWCVTGREGGRVEACCCISVCQAAVAAQLHAAPAPGCTMALPAQTLTVRVQPDEWDRVQSCCHLLA